MRQEDIDRFWSKVGILGEDDCWEWKAFRDSDGYGRFKVFGIGLIAHRVSYFISTGKVPRGLMVLHSCDNPPCVNPKHLRSGTSQENMDDMVDRKRSLTGTKNHKSKLTESDIVDIRTRFKIHGHFMHDIGRDYGISKFNVMCIVYGQTWRDVAVKLISVKPIIPEQIKKRRGLRLAIKLLNSLHG